MFRTFSACSSSLSDYQWVLGWYPSIVPITKIQTQNMFVKPILTHVVKHRTKKTKLQHSICKIVQLFSRNICTEDFKLTMFYKKFTYIVW